MEMKKRLLLLLMSLLMVFPVYIHAEGMQDFLHFPENGEPVAFELDTEIFKIPQFDENRTEQLNRLLKHIHFSGIVSEKETEVTVSLDNEELFSILSFDYSGKNRTVFATDHEHYYSSETLEHACKDMLPVSKGETAKIERSQKIQQSLETVAGFLEKLPEAFQEKASRTKNTEKYRDYGTASYKIVLKLTDEEMNNYLQQFLKSSDTIHSDPYLEKLVFTGRQGFTLLYTEDNRLLKVSYSGKAFWKENDIRDIRLEWKTVHRNGYARDELQLRTPNEKRNARNNLVLSCILYREEDGSEKLTWSEETDSLENRIRKQGKLEAEFILKGNSLTGSVTDITKSDNVTTSETVLIDWFAPQHNSWTGTLEIISKKDKIEKAHIRAVLSLKAGISVPVSSGQPEAVYVNETEFSRITEELYSEILARILKLPAEDQAFIREGIPDSLWNTIVNTK